MDKGATKIIKTQAELDSLRSEESGMYYISLSGSVCIFNGKSAMNLIQANERLTQIAAGQSEYIAECFTKQETQEGNEAIDVSLKTYLIPYRYH